MKYSCLFYFYFCLTLFFCSQANAQGFKGTLGVVGWGKYDSLSSSNVKEGLSKQVFGLELKGYSLKGKFAYGSRLFPISISDGFYVNDNFIHYLPSLGRYNRLKAIFGIGSKIAFVQEMDPIFFLMGHLGLQYRFKFSKSKPSSLLFYTNYSPIYDLSRPFEYQANKLKSRFLAGQFNIGLGLTFGRSKNKETANDTENDEEEPAHTEISDNKQTTQNLSSEIVPLMNESSIMNAPKPVAIKPGNILIDVDGNNYKTTWIGNRRWMAENLKVSHFNNGDTILEIRSDMAWASANKGAWAIYNHSAAFDKVVGKLYNGFVITDARQICPTGWHIPSEMEWNELIEWLGGASQAGTKIKTVQGWNSTVKGNNASTLNGLPGGGRHESGFFNGAGKFLAWWSSSIDQSGLTLENRFISSEKTSISKTMVKRNFGFSIRCIEDLKVK